MSWVNGVQLIMISSLKANWKGMALMACSAMTVAIGQMLWKLSGGQNVILLGVGFSLYGLGALLMVLAFKHGKLSVVHPVLSLSYVFGIVFGYVFLGECLRPVQYLAIAFIMAGVVCIGGGEHE